MKRIRPKNAYFPRCFHCSIPAYETAGKRAALFALWLLWVEEGEEEEETLSDLRQKRRETMKAARKEDCPV